MKKDKKGCCIGARLTALLLALMMLLTACGGSTGQASNGSQESAKPEQTEQSQPEETKAPVKETDEGYIQETDGYTAMTHWVKDDSTSTKIFGKLYRPADFDENKQYPVIIMSHGLGVTHNDFDAYIAPFMDLDVLCYAFDFPGGSMQSKSKGDVKEMSVLTEKEALKQVLADIQGQSYTDPEKIVLMGGSQGGVVTGLTAVDVAEQIAGEILLYPALVIVDNAKKDYSSLDDVPESINVRGLNLGKVYYSDVWDMDLTTEITKYPGSVLIIHGTADDAVPYEYSERAQEQFADARLVMVEDGGHGFTPEEVTQFFPEITQYLTDLGVIG